jgi:soluble lytic murein transglycosylase-like protein
MSPCRYQRCRNREEGILMKTLSLFGLMVWLSMAQPAVASAGEPASLQEMTMAAQRYENAEGVPKDYLKAHELYCSAARAGFADAQYALGWMYANGRGVRRNSDTAAQLFQLAAEQGHVQASELILRLSQSLHSNTAEALPECMMADTLASPLEQPATLPGKVYPQGKIAKLVAKLAPLYSIDPELAMAIISVESQFNERAVSPKNAQGLMQLMPETAERFKVKDAFDAEQNLKGGLSYLRWLLAFFRGNVSLVAAAYNSGERTVEKYRGIPPYLETLNYVKKVHSLYQKPTHPFQRNLVSSSTVVMRQTLGFH